MSAPEEVKDTELDNGMTLREFPDGTAMFISWHDHGDGDIRTDSASRLSANAYNKLMEVFREKFAGNRVAVQRGDEGS